MHRTLSVAFLLVFVAAAAAAQDPLLAEAWPQRPGTPLHEIGSGVAVVFSPDLSVPGTCNFYAALGFACFSETDWAAVRDGIRTFNAAHPERRIRTLVLETHGTNGHGLKLQGSYDPRASRSYISVGALQEWLEEEGVRYLVLGSCNSGRLLRPEIHRRLNPYPGDKLFLPPTHGIYAASDSYDLERSLVTLLMPASSQVEMTVVGSVDEFAPRVQEAIRASAAANGVGRPEQFVISDLMMQMIMREPSLRLKIGEPAYRISGTRSSPDVSEMLFTRLVAHLDAAAAPAESAAVVETVLR